MNPTQLSLPGVRARLCALSPHSAALVIALGGLCLSAHAADVIVDQNFSGTAADLQATFGAWDSTTTNQLFLGKVNSGLTITITDGILSGKVAGNNNIGGAETYGKVKVGGGSGNTITLTGANTALYDNNTSNWGAGSAKWPFQINGTNNLLVLSDGARLFAKGYNTILSSNQLRVTGAGSYAGFSLDNSDGFSNDNPNRYAARIHVEDGGRLDIKGSGLTGGFATPASGEYLVRVDGVDSVFSPHAFSYYEDFTASAIGGIVHCTNGGALESDQNFLHYNTNNSEKNTATASHIFIDGGVMSFKDVSGVNMAASTTFVALGVESIYNLTWQGDNGFRLNNASSNDTGTYTLANSAITGDPRNYTRLEMVNGTTSVARAITIDGDNGGSIRFDGTAATIANGITLSGAAATLTASGADSTLTGDVTGGSLVKAGSAKLTLNTAPTYSGDTLVNEGTLALAGVNPANETSNVFMITGGKLDLAFGGTDTVDKLYINGELQASGTWGSTTSGATHKDDMYFAGSGTLTVSSGTASTPYQTWAGGAGFTTDLNQDGVTNGLAWMLGAAGPSANGQAVLPAVGTIPGYMTLDFLRVHGMGAAHLILEYSNDLNSSDPWHSVDLGGPLGDIVVTVVTGSPNDEVTVKIPTSHASSGGSLFARLLATEN